MRDKGRDFADILAEAQALDMQKLILLLMLKALMPDTN